MSAVESVEQGGRRVLVPEEDLESGTVVLAGAAEGKAGFGTEGKARVAAGQ